MKLILKKDFETEEELRSYIIENKIEIPDYRCAVISMLFDKDGNIILQRRGPKSRDDAGKLADIGGAVEKTDLSLRAALNRELKEEVGDTAEITIDAFIGGILQTKYDPRTKQDVNWLFLLYKCTYLSGELKCNEEGKSLGYELYKPDKLPINEMLETTNYFWDYYLNRYNKCYSYAMGIGEKITALDKNKFTINEDDGDYEITFNKEDADEYEKFIIEKLDYGFWNEYIVDDKIIFIFKENETTAKRYILSKENNEEILVMCRAYAEAEFLSVHQMYIDTPFYSDKLEGVIFYD